MGDTVQTPGEQSLLRVVCGKNQGYNDLLDLAIPRICSQALLQIFLLHSRGYRLLRALFQLQTRAPIEIVP